MIEHNHGDVGYIMICGFISFLMIPGLGIFYSGMTMSKNMYSILFLCLCCICIVSIEWFAIGYSMVFSTTSNNNFIGNFDFVFLSGVLDTPTINKIPEMLFQLFQCMFAAITPAITIGASVERGRIGPCMIFILLWSIFVYNFIAYWTFCKNGWANKLGALDFAGGTPVHISSGISSMVFSLVIGRRKQLKVISSENIEQSNLFSILLGTSILWFGWFAFNSGSALSSNMRAIHSCMATLLASSAGGLTWLLIDMFMSKNKTYCVIGFCNGVLSGLIAITPGAGLVDLWASLIFGVCGGIICNFCVRLKHKLSYVFDDALDIFPLHGVGGILGSLLTGMFASKNIANLDNDLVIDGGLIDRNPKQLLYQLYATLGCVAWSMGVTFVILTLMNLTRFTSLRINEQTEISGIDYNELGIKNILNKKVDNDDEKAVSNVISTR